MTDARPICTTDRSALRAWIPSGYDARLHVAGMFALGGLAITALLTWHHASIGPRDLWAIPAMLLAGTFVEYAAHRWLMHQRQSWFGLPWDAHTGRHHHFYLSDAPTWDAASDIWLILFSPKDVVLLTVVLAVPAAALSTVMAPGAWVLGTCTAVAYFLAYEGLHLLFHLPADSAWLRLPSMGSMRRRHLRHHQLADMHANYGVTFPLWDRLLGTERAPRQDLP